MNAINNLQHKEYGSEYHWIDYLIRKAAVFDPDQNSPLINKAIYPAILSPIPSRTQQYFTDKTIALSERMLSIHIDGRYKEADMAHICSALRDVI